MKSCNHPEAIFVSETRSTHVADAGIKLAVVAENDLELMTLLSILGKCEITQFLCGIRD